MPVRIYDIAKRIGVTNKVVIARASDLGITGARVPSSTLDKITAAYLEDELAKEFGVKQEERKEPPKQPAEETPEAPAAAVHPPPEEPPAPPAPPTPELGEKVGWIQLPPPRRPAGQPASGKPTFPVPPAPPAKPSQDQPPTAVPEAPQLPPPPVATPPSTEPVSAPTAEAPEQPAPAAAETEPAPPPPPPTPPPPKLGEKVGWIQLPPRRQPDRPSGRPGARGSADKADTGKGKDGRAGVRGDGVAGGRATPQPEARPGPKLPPLPPPDSIKGPEITLRPPIVVRDLADRMNRKPFQVIADLMEMGIFATVNQSLEPEVAQRICAKYRFRFKVERRQKGEGLVQKQESKIELADEEDRPEELEQRAPVVTIMGHVDHGKTTLLDVIRKTNVAASEAGGITQHIGAYTITVPYPGRPKQLHRMTFLDTPGHAAFSSMRARGANVTDIVILVVAANDGVMPQTMEALNHARAAKVPIIVAVNKCDLPGANPMRVRQELQEKGLAPDDWGGDTIFVDISALAKQGIDKLLEMVLLQAEMLELKANPNRSAKGNVVESGLEPGGPTATVLVRKGTLRVGQTVLCGEYYGRVRALINDRNKRLKEATPSTAVKLLGLNGVPKAGLEFAVIEDEKVARNLSEQHAEQSGRNRQAQGHKQRASLGDIFRALEHEASKVLKLVIKADAQGSVEAIVDALQKIDTTKVSLEIIHSEVGTISENDVLLATASEAVILGFHSRVDNPAAELAKRERVEIRLYAVIYELIDQVRDAMAGLLDPLLKEVVIGAAEVRKVFSLSKGGNVAGCVVANGRLTRGKARVMRRKNLIYEGLIQTLQRFQDEVNEVRSGMECGIRLDGFNEFEEGDSIECYTVEKIAQQL